MDYDDFDDGRDFEDDEYEYGYDRLIDDSEDMYSYDDDRFDYNDVERAEMQEWERWAEEIKG